MAKTDNRAHSTSSTGDDGRTVAALIIAWMVIQPWVMGGVFWWSEALNTLLGVAALTFALKSAENRRVLWRFPVFWLGLLFCGYILCQGLNAWGYTVQREPGVIMYDVYALPHLSWLPAGLRTSYFAPGTWRTLVYWLGPWLLVSAWWAAVRRRRTGRRLALAAFINGVVMAVVVIIERFHPPHAILWLYTFPGMYPSQTGYGAFADHNKTAAFLYLAMGAGFAVACRLQERARERGRDDGLTWIALLGCMMILASFFSLGSRAGLAVASAVFAGGLMILLGAALRAHDRSPGLWMGSLVLLIAVAGWGLFEFCNRDTGTLFRIKYLQEHPEEDTRALLHRETRHMIAAHPWLGWGGGTYRYVSPNFFIEDYVFVDSRYDGGLSQRADWAHSDWLQYPMEFGFIGASLPLAILLYLFMRGLWLSRRLGAEGLVVLLACAGLLAHAAVDFPSYNAAVLLVFCLLLVSTVKTGELAAKRAS